MKKTTLAFVAAAILVGFFLVTPALGQEEDYLAFGAYETRGSGLVFDHPFYTDESLTFWYPFHPEPWYYDFSDVPVYRPAYHWKYPMTWLPAPNKKTIDIGKYNPKKIAPQQKKIIQLGGYRRPA